MLIDGDGGVVSVTTRRAAEDEVEHRRTE